MAKGLKYEHFTENSCPVLYGDRTEQQHRRVRLLVSGECNILLPVSPVTFLDKITKLIEQRKAAPNDNIEEEEDRSEDSFRSVNLT